MQDVFYIFTDESGQDADNRFGCIAAISGTKENAEVLNSELQKVLSSYSKKEIKFKNIKNSNSVKIASEFFEICIKYLLGNKIKIHVLVWDKQDARHKVQNRLDNENLKRMYYKLMKYIQEDWHHKGKWCFYPDEYSAIDWRKDIVLFLENTPLGEPKDKEHLLFEEMYKSYFAKFKTVKELESHQYPIIQLADLFAGLVRTSRQNPNFYTWYKENENTDQHLLFPQEENTKVSNSMLPKFKLMKELKFLASNSKLGINLSKNKYFTTFNKKNNIVFWHYKPTHELDKAPTYF
ncbi:DUF3800 domain-containing protein [Labilibaculum sp. A4]|uniref:DUF3800 domain-containing protein n=1 Tax=Labilibaculum euxinus TaxID=2686357 RepID=UPI000F6176E1|nr:DUF3800 domain-containing protein [Labilibaculum euxinus]MDQ1769360.1 DUF3800 domain-containing protein [Labilibaculum euxinus]MWN74886.1 DUF3800 domain-containing protein [Labilibaculum euxinus]